MAQTPEGKVKSAIKAYLTQVGAVWNMPIGGPYATAGVEDFIACFRGRYVGIEAKAPGKKIARDDPQDRRRDAIVAAGGIHIEADDVSIVKQVFAREFGV